MSTLAASPPIRVIAIDDHPMVHVALRIIFEDAQDVAIIGRATTGATGLRLIDELRPDVLILDRLLRDMDGLELATSVRTRHPTVRILILTGHDDADAHESLTRIGVAGYLLKTAMPQEILAAVRAIAMDGSSSNGRPSARHWSMALVP